MKLIRRCVIGQIASVALFLSPALLAADAPQSIIPVTTSSAEARALYLEGRDLSERLKGTDAHLKFAAAVKKDPDFAMGWFQISQTSGTAKEFLASLKKAVALSAKASEGERLQIEAADAGSRSRPAEQQKLLTELVAKYPGDPRAHFQLGALYFGLQDWDRSIQELSRATELDAQYSAPYNQLGYAYRAEDKNAEAEKAFQTYARLLPDDPNPHDSYAELLMRLGRFDESIAEYRKALQADPNFLSALIGIANDQIFLGKGDDARATIKDMRARSRTDGEKRTSWFWSAETYAHEGRWSEAIDCLKEEKKIADASGDLLSASQDLNFVGNLLLGAGKPDEAAAQFEASLQLADKAKMPAEAKAAVRRNHAFDLARVALARGDLAQARRISTSYSADVASHKVLVEVRQAHELAGMIAVQAKEWDAAIAALADANQQSPRVLYWSGLAWQGKGDAAKANAAFKAAADFNQLNGQYAFVRADARRQLAKS